MAPQALLSLVKTRPKSNRNWRAYALKLEEHAYNAAKEAEGWRKHFSREPRDLLAPGNADALYAIKRVIG